MLQRPGSSWGFGVRPCSRSWYWHLNTSVVVLKEDTPPTNNPCRTWDSNPQPSAYKSDSLSIRPRLPLSLNIDKTKELVVDFRRQSREHTPITIDKTPVERVNSFKFLGVHITEDLTWSTHTDAVLKKTHQRLFFLRRLRKFGMSPSILRSFYTCTMESILTGCITAFSLRLSG